MSAADRERHEMRLYWTWHAAAATARATRAPADQEAARKAWSAFQGAFAPERDQRREVVPCP